MAVVLSAGPGLEPYRHAQELPSPGAALSNGGGKPSGQGASPLQRFQHPLRLAGVWVHPATPHAWADLTQVLGGVGVGIAVI